MLFRQCDKAQLDAAMVATNKLYGGNLAFRRCDRAGSGFTVTLRTLDSKAHGSRTSASGRHGPYASWEAHRDFMAALFAVNPGARITSAMADYRGIDEFLKKFPETRYKQVGSPMFPVTFGELSV